MSWLPDDMTDDAADADAAGITTSFAARVADAALAGSPMTWHDQAQP